jgi:ribosomal protein L34E
MPYKSRAQQRLFHHLVSQGKLAPEVAAEYDDASKGKKIPEYVKRKAFGGEVDAASGARCPACDYPLDEIPVAKDAGEACPRCGFGSAKDVPVRKAQGGEIMDSSMYRARGGEMCEHCGAPMAYGGEAAKPTMKELYISKKRPEIDDGKIGGSFAKALKHRRG